jgi:N-acyl-D-amino-acid deacylase
MIENTTSSKDIKVVPQLKILIRNAAIIDGSGSPAYQADLAVMDDRIMDIGRFPNAQADLDIDAAGKVLCPGFIDPHSHSELAMLEGKHTAGVQMGVTTEFTGPDGFGFAPLSAGRLEEYRAYLHGIYGDVDLDWNWRTFGEYLNRFEGRVYNNVVPQIPHGAVRLAVKGWAAGPANDDELEAMRRLARDCMENGSVGIATGLDYVPGSHADLRELVELSKIAAEYGGVYATHMRGYGEEEREAAIAETLSIAEGASIGVHISHFFGNPHIYASTEAARARGIDITLDAYPYPAGATLLTFVFPRSLITTSVNDFLKKIHTPEIRQIVKQALDNKLSEDNPAYFAYLAKPKNKWMEGKRVRDAWRESSHNAFDQFVCDLLVDEGMAPLLVYPWSNLPEGNEERLRCSLTHPLQMVITDGIYVGGSAHPRGWGTYPRLLGKYVREKGWLTLEDAVRRMTSFPAARFGLTDRGLIKKGLAADLVIFDANTVRDRATWKEPRLSPEGIDYVFVNGSQVVDKGRLLEGNYPGHVLRRNR